MPHEELRAAFLRLSGEQVFRILLRRMEERGKIERRGADIRPRGHRPRMKPEQQEWLERIEGAYRKAGFTTPLPDDVRRKLGVPPRAFDDLLHALFERGDLVRLSGKVIYHREAVQRARRVVIQYLKRYPSVIVAELRDILGLSRKYATAILEYFDEVGLTKREKDVHTLA